MYAPEGDQSLGLRNWLAYNSARRMGRYAMRTQYAELFLIQVCVCVLFVLCCLHTCVCVYCTMCAAQAERCKCMWRCAVHEQCTWQCARACASLRCSAAVQQAGARRKNPFTHAACSHAAHTGQPPAVKRPLPRAVHCRGVSRARQEPRQRQQV